MAKTYLPVRKAFVQKYPYELDTVQYLQESTGDVRKYLVEYPTVYVITLRESEGYRVYVGETNSIVQRTRQHLLGDTKQPTLKRETW
jgi:hypothetical protein